MSFSADIAKWYSSKIDGSIVLPTFNSGLFYAAILLFDLCINWIKDIRKY